MKNHTSKITVIAAILVYSLLCAGDSNAKQRTVSVGGYDIGYDEAFAADTNANGKDDRTSYYAGGNLVFTAYDENEDGKPDLWFRYTNGDMLDLELADADANGKPDVITEIDAAGKAEVIFDTGVSGGSSDSGVYGWAILALLGAALFIAKKLFKKKGDAAAA